MLRNLKIMNTSDDVRSVADYLGSPMFSPGTMKFFKSKLLDFHARLDDDSGYIITSDMSPSGRSYVLWAYRIARETWKREGDDFMEERDTISFDQVGRYTSAQWARRAGRSHQG